MCKKIFQCFHRGFFNSDGFIIDIQGNLIEDYLEAAIYNPDPEVFPQFCDFIISEIIDISRKYPGEILASQVQIAGAIGRMFELRAGRDEALIKLIHDCRIPFATRAKAFELNRSYQALSSLYRPIAENVLVNISSKDRLETGALWIPEEICQSILNNYF